MLTKGTCFNISLNGKRPLWGYFLLVTDQGEEFIIKRNSKIPFDRYRKVYQTNHSFKDQIFSKKAPANISSLIGVPLGLLLARTFRKILPMDLFFGKANLDLNVREGAINVLLFLFAVMITLWLVTIARYVQLKQFVKKNGADKAYRVSPKNSKWNRGVVNAKNKKTSIVCPGLFKHDSPVFSIFCSNALVFGIDFIFVGRSLL